MHVWLHIHFSLHGVTHHSASIFSCIKDWTNSQDVEPVMFWSKYQWHIFVSNRLDNEIEWMTEYKKDFWQSIHMPSKSKERQREQWIQKWTLSGPTWVAWLEHRGDDDVIYDTGSATWSPTQWLPSTTGLKCHCIWPQKSLQLLAKFQLKTSNHEEDILNADSERLEFYWHYCQVE